MFVVQEEVDYPPIEEPPSEERQMVICEEETTSIKDEKEVATLSLNALVGWDSPETSVRYCG